jgi:hypothetical protein
MRFRYSVISFFKIIILTSGLDLTQCVFRWTHKYFRKNSPLLKITKFFFKIFIIGWSLLMRYSGQLQKWPLVSLTELFQQCSFRTD